MESKKVVHCCGRRGDGNIGFMLYWVAYSLYITAACNDKQLQTGKTLRGPLYNVFKYN